ncbi:MAG: VOC family protein [Candidatus Sericytochromatia bacterium]
MSRISRFEIHADRPQGLVDYYSALLGWRFTKLPMPNLDYWLIETGTPDDPGLSGGLLARPVTEPVSTQAVNAFICTMDVDDIDAILEENEGLGGTVALPKMAVPGMGWVAYLKDPDGNLFGLMQAETAAEPEA